ncbi:MAG: DNRLRE domain-containing protein, partial [Acidimicrobiia bacterium]|nr:DNRLRE domain-containing protein [Acidimicrobiia bacterium]
MVLLTSLVVAIPAAAAGLGGEIAEVESVDPASDPYRLPASTDTPTGEQRLPVLDLSDIEGLWPADAVEMPPAPLDPESPEEALAGTKLLPDEGTASLDVYGVGPEDTAHVAVVYPEDVNKLQPDGEWRDIKVQITEESKGWRWVTPSGTSSFLPAELSVERPVTFSLPEGELSLSPTGGKSVGAAEGASVTYPNAFPEGADLRYAATLGGLVEHIMLPRQPTSSTFSFDIAAEGLSLAANDHGGIDVLDGLGELQAVFPAAVAYDASEEPLSSTGGYVLTDLGAGSWNLAVTIDPEFLKIATYPVEIDPTWDDTANRDGYTNQASAGTSYESDQYLQVDSNKRSYLRFQTGSIDAFDLIVYDATMFLYPQGSGGVSGGIAAKRVTEAWPSAGTLKWNNQPTVGSEFDTVSAASNSGWWDWDLDALYQHYLDLGNQWNSHWDNEGVGLTASNPKTFHAVDSTLGNSDPALYVTYNNPPDAPSLNTPNAGYVSESESLTLKVDGGAQWPDDADNDEVLVSFQISDNGTDWTGSNLVFQSPYDDAWSFTVPAGVLLDGQQYYWRAISRDVCDPQTQGLCSLTDGAGTKRDPKASAVKGFTVALKRFGSDDRWHMWSHDVGNGMTMQVNGSNGNLVLDVPLDDYSTPIGDLEIGLSYNSQQNADFGMGPGWDLAIGPRGDQDSLPVELTKMDTGSDADLKVRFKGGRTLYFPHQTGKHWGATSAMSGYITQAKNNRFTYFSADGGMYTFDSGALNGAPILKAKPAQAAAEAPDKEYTYTYDSSLQLTKVEDPLSRDIDITWNGQGRVDLITAAGYGGQVFDPVYANGQLTSIATSVKNPSIGGAAGTTVTETKQFTYVAGSGFDA